MIETNCEWKSEVTIQYSLFIQRKLIIFGATFRADHMPRHRICQSVRVLAGFYYVEHIGICTSLILEQ